MRISKTRQYKCWQNMKNRCDNKNVASYENYGGRGITYDPKWKTFDGFWEDMKRGYADYLTLERVDVDGDYCKTNCTWIPKGEQCRNTRKNVIVEYKGRPIKLFALAELVGINYHTLYNRIFTSKMPVEKAVSKSFFRGKYKRKLKTHCKRGHVFDEENTYYAKNGTRFCRTCRRMHANNLNKRRRDLSIIH